MAYELLVFLMLSVGALIAAWIWAERSKALFPVWFLVGGVLLRIVGAILRYEIIFQYYGGLGDAVRYYEEGLYFADAARVDPSGVFSLAFWVPELEPWWGTRFMERLSGLVLLALGPSLRGEFLFFSLLAFVGLVAVARAFAIVQADPVARRRFFLLLCVWPSLWFWPSSVGKEAVVMLALGLTTLGYVGSGARIRWVQLLGGLALAYAIRPHVAVVLGLAVLAAHWFGSWKRASPGRLVEAAIAVVLVVFAFQGMRVQFGLQEADLEGMREFVEYTSEQTLQGGSNIGSVPLSATGVPIALVNVWARPFPWEAHNATSGMAAVEMLVLWGLILYRRKQVAVALRAWRRHRLLRFGLPFLILYTLMIGLAFGNLGIIARQRAPIFAFLLLLPSVASDRPSRASPRPRELPRPRPGNVGVS